MLVVVLVLCPVLNLRLFSTAVMVFSAATLRLCLETGTLAKTTPILSEIVPLGSIGLITYKNIINHK